MDFVKMKMTKFAIHRFKLVAFSGIETVVYTPEESVQIIIGTNGSGKSSLIRQFSPLPVPSNQMLDGGYKKIWIEDKGRNFRLENHFGKKNIHHFYEILEDGVEKDHNVGGTGKEQIGLVERFFGITNEVMQILLGLPRHRFTNMTPSKRRDWILKLSNSDIDYVMGVYNNAKRYYNDAVSVDKHHAERLANESSDLIDKERIAALERNIANITSVITEAMYQRDKDVPALFRITNDLKEVRDDYDKCTAEMFTLHIVKPHILYQVDNNLGAVELHLNTLKTRQAVYQEQLEAHYKERDQVEETIIAMEASGVSKHSELNKIVTGLEAEKQALVRNNNFYEKFKNDDIDRAIERFSTARELLTEYLSGMLDNTDKRFTKSTVQAARARANVNEASISSSNARIQFLNHSLEHWTKGDRVDCPKCEHSFLPGLSAFNPDEAKAEIESIGKKVDAMQTEQKSIVEFLDTAKEYATQTRSIRDVFDRYPEFGDIWDDLVNKHNLFSSAPLACLPLLARHSEAVIQCKKIKEVDLKLEVNRLVLKNIQDSGGKDIYNTEYLNNIDNRISITIDNIDVMKQDIHCVNKFLTEMTKATKCMLRINDLFDRTVKLHETLLLAIKNKVISDHIQNKQVELAEMNVILNSASRHEAVIAEITREKIASRERVENYGLIVKSLSPVDGIISRYLQQYIDLFIGDINSVIDKIWTTDMVVLGCAVDSNDVTCKFPLDINNGFITTSDISESSDGQADIINLGFRLVVGKYLGLVDIPLWLDELAPTLDEAHRHRLTQYLNQLMEEGMYSQMFMISHYAATHYSFGNADIFMLDSRNIINKPKEFNKVVELAYTSEVIC